MSEEARTPEEIATAIARKWFMDAPYMYHDEAGAVIADIVAAIRDAYEQAAKITDDRIDPEWPGDDLSRQAERIARDIRALKGDKRS